MIVRRDEFSSCRQHSMRWMLSGWWAVGVSLQMMRELRWTCLAWLSFFVFSGRGSGLMGLSVDAINQGIAVLCARWPRISGWAPGVLEPQGQVLVGGEVAAVASICPRPVALL